MNVIVKMLNKKGDMSIVLLVLLTFLAVGAALFSFVTSGSVAKEVIDPRVVESVYVQENSIKFYLNEIGKKALVKTYSDFANDGDYVSVPVKFNSGYPYFDNLRPDLNGVFIKKFKENFRNEIKSYNFEEDYLKQINSKEFETFGNYNDFEVVFKNLEMKQSFGEENILNVYYKPEIKIQLSFSKIGLINFNELYEIKIECKNIDCPLEKSEFSITDGEISIGGKMKRMISFESQKKFLTDSGLDSVKFGFIPE